MSIFEKKSLSNLGVTLFDCVHATPTAMSEGYTYIAIPDLIEGRIDTSKSRLISTSDYQRWTAKLRPRAGDIVMTRRGRVGDTAPIPQGLDCAIGQNLVILRSQSDCIDQKYLRWALRGPEYYVEVNRLKNEGAVFDSLNCRDIPKIEIPVPPLPEQQAIAEVLGALDDKIELNRRMNATLEELARTVFRSWFVDFDPVHAKAEGRAPFGMDADTAALFPDSFVPSELGDIPAGWVVQPVSEVAGINTWTLGKKDVLDPIEYVEISSVNRGDITEIVTYPRGTEPGRARRRLRHGDTVVSMVRPDRGAYFLALDPPANRLASTGFAVVTPVGAPWSVVHAALTQPEVSSTLGHLADGGAYPAVRPERIAELPIVLPLVSWITDEFHRLAEPLYEKAALNRRESQTLAELRDTLLPKLLSGEITVKAAERELVSST